MIDTIIYVAIIILTLVISYRLLKFGYHSYLTVKDGARTKRAVREQSTGRRILFAGDSITVGVGAITPDQSLAGRIISDYPEISLVNRAKNAIKVSDLSKILDSEPTAVYDLVILQIGGMDTVLFTSLQSFREELDKCLSKAKVIGQNNVILLTVNNAGASPYFPWPLNLIYRWRSRQIANLMEQAATAAGVEYVRLYRELTDNPFYQNPDLLSRDKTHPNGDGYAIWYDWLKPSLDKTLNKTHDYRTY